MSTGRAPAWTRRGRLACAVLCLWAAPAGARLVTLTVLNTTDMHGSIRRTPDTVYADHNDGSLLQCATLIRRIRAENPNTLLVDCGDIFQGTAESYLTQGGIMARAMNALGYDAWVVGNHEFDWGLAPLARLIEKMQATPLAANLVLEEGVPEAFRQVQPFILREVDGLRVAIVGLTTPGLPLWFRHLHAQGVRVVDSRRALEKILPQVRQHRPHILILLAHQGLLSSDDKANEIVSIGRRFGEFDLMLGGHLHWVLAGTRVGRVAYAQAGSGARGIMRIDLDFDTVRNAVVDKRFAYLPVTEDIPEDPELAALVAADLARADEWLAQVLGRTTGNLTSSSAGAGLSPVQQLLCTAIAAATGAEVVIHGILSPHGLPAGEIRVADIWRIVPYENQIGCAWLTPGEIHAIMEEAAGFLGTDRYSATWGLQYEVHSYAPPGRRIRHLRDAAGQPIHARRRLKVAFNSYQISGGGGRFPRLSELVHAPQARLEIQGSGTRDMVMDYVRRHRELTISPGTNAVMVRREPERRRGRPRSR